MTIEGVGEDLHLARMRFAMRVSRLQSCCEREGLDALLAVAGIDGGYNKGSHSIIRFCFLGGSGRSLYEPVGLPPELEDLVMVVRPDGLGLFCTPAAHAKIASLVSYVEDVETIVATEEEMDDPDRLEDLKVASTVQLLRGMQDVGVPVSSDAGSNINIANTQVESWPLIQAYGLEGVGRQGFFTMAHRVHFVLESVWAAFKPIDSTSLLHHLEDSLARLRRHWQEAMHVISQTSLTKRSELTEKAIAEPLENCYAYGGLRPADGVSTAAVMPPKVRFSGRTCDDGDDEAGRDCSFGECARQAGAQPLHMVLEAADARSALRAARTYFLTTGGLADDTIWRIMHQDDDEDVLAAHAQQMEEWQQPEDAQYLMMLYSALVEAAHEGISTFCKTDGGADAACRAAEACFLAAAEKVCTRAWADGQAAPRAADVASQLQVELWACDDANHLTPAPTRGDGQLKVLSLRLHHVASLAQHTGTPELGSLAYADTFLDLPQPALPHQTAGGGMQPCLLNLTQALPAGSCFSFGSLEAAIADRCRGAAERYTQLPLPGTAADLHADAARAWPLGMPLDDFGGEQVTLLTPSASTAAGISGSLHCFAGGLLLLGDGAPTLVDFRRDLQRLSLQRDATSSSDLLVLWGHQPACGVLPAAWLTDSRCLALDLGGLLPAARRHLVRSVIPVWQQTCRELGIPHDAPAGADSSAALFPPLVQQQHAACRLLDAQPPGFGLCLPDAHVRCAVLPALDASERCDRPGRSRAVEEALGLPEQERGDAAAVPLLLVAGQPGLLQDRVVAAVTGHLQAFSWHRMQQPLAACLRVDSSWLKPAFAALAADLAAERAQRRHQHPAVVVATASLDGVQAQLEEVVEAAAAAAPGLQLRIAGVVSCLAASAVFDTRELLMPGVWRQLHPGLVHAVVLEGGKDVLESGAARLVRQRNPRAALVSAHNLLPSLGKVVGSLEDYTAFVRAGAALRRLPCRGARPATAVAGRLRAVFAHARGLADAALASRELHKACSGGGDNVWRSDAPLALEDAAGRPADQPPTIFRVVAVVQPADNSSLPASLCVGRWQPANPSPAAAGSTASSSAGSVQMLVVGAGVTDAWAEQLLRSCCAAGQPAAGKKLRDEVSLTPAERAQIAKEHMWDDLPDGYRCTGDAFVDPFGDVCPEHPLMSRFIAQYLDNLNRKIASCNAHACQQRESASTAFQLLCTCSSD